eukprot:CAMPEP_0117743394 /NCGR_PEP_ID=MMETSP0947-20121206/6106_1 /TAXON_ID=44440 /ORGANISM="Chattonella subsalsa, Strain CCMP2191" /LENGTH=655 /DNA_ID=CAMNT_0005560081 /DNA_START=64 /DNA_END=2031 /DNA_ORIENTATION=+
MTDSGKIAYHYMVASIAAAVTAMLMAIKEADPPSISNAIVQLLDFKLRILAMLNLICCIVYFTVIGIIRFFFGKLRTTEKKQVQERLVSYITFKVVFVGAILEPALSELLIWVGWFLLIGLMKMLAYIAIERFYHIVDNPLATQTQWSKTVGLLIVLVVANIFWTLISANFFNQAGLSTLLLLLFDCFTLFIETLQALVKYSYQLLEIILQADWERKQATLRYIDFAAELLVLFSTMCHYLHIWSLNGVSFTLIDAIIILNLRGVYNKMRRKHTSFIKFRELDRHMDDMFPNAQQEELAQLPEDEVCAICLKPFQAAKKLPCGHFFHMPCLRQCLERATGTHAALCPLCRMPVSGDARNGTPSEVHGPGEAPNSNQVLATGQEGIPLFNANIPNRPGVNSTNTGETEEGHTNPVPEIPQQEVFRFSNAHLPRWLPVPAFSFELIHSRMDSTGMGLDRGQHLNPAPPDHSILVAQLADMFPDISRNILVHELERDGNMEAAVDRLLQSQTQNPIHTPAPFPASVSEELTSSPLASLQEEGSSYVNTPHPTLHSIAQPQLNQPVPGPRASENPHPQANFLGILGALFGNQGTQQGDNTWNDREIPNPNSPLYQQGLSSNILPTAPVSMPSESEPIEVRRARQLEAIQRRQQNNIDGS